MCVDRVADREEGIVTVREAQRDVALLGLSVWTLTDVYRAKPGSRPRVDCVTMPDRRLVGD